MDIDSIVWPAHKGGLHISRNQHYGYYETVTEAIGDRPGATYRSGDFINPEDRARCIELDSVWTVQWYPDTPVGFHVVHASSLSLALEHALKL